MFNNKTNNTTKETASGRATIIAAGTEINGHINSKGDIRVDGTLTGNLSTTGKVIVGPSGHVKGDIDSSTAEVLGRITGNVKVAELLSLKGTCEVNGNIYTGQLQVDATAAFNGECHMGVSSGASIVAIKNETVHAAASHQ